MLGNTSIGDYINMGRSGMIHKCPITPEAVTIANTIFGFDISTLKGKTTWKYSEPAVTDYGEIPYHILDLKSK